MFQIFPRAAWKKLHPYIQKQSVWCQEYSQDGRSVCCCYDYLVGGQLQNCMVSCILHIIGYVMSATCHAEWEYPQHGGCRKKTDSLNTATDSLPKEGLFIVSSTDREWPVSLPQQFFALLLLYLVLPLSASALPLSRIPSAWRSLLTAHLALLSALLWPSTAHSHCKGRLWLKI